MLKAWKDIDWSAPRPDEPEIERSWETLAFESFDVASGAAQRVQQELNRVFRNGGMLLKGFSVITQSDATHWFLSRNRFAEYEFFRFLLESSAVREGLPELRLGPALRHQPKFKEVWGGTLTLDGQLAAHLVKDGAYSDGRFDGSAQEAKELTARFVHDLTANRHEDFCVYRCYEPWSPWFRAVVWDTTYFIIDLLRNRVVLLCMTDTD